MARFTFISTILLAVTISCSQGNHDGGYLNGPLPAAGIIHKNLHCRHDSVFSYSLYLPVADSGLLSGKDQAAKNKTATFSLHPVIFIFDPHADGVLPLTLYRRLADRYGFILVGSNDIENGMSPEEIRKITSALMVEFKTRYPVDSGRIYLMGFSGGARMAALAGLYFQKVGGVIGCGAGFNGLNYPPSFQFDYFGMAGLGDFNLQEMLSLEKPLQEAGFRLLITTWPGKHAWPPEPEMEKAFRWITLNAMRDGQISRDTGFIAEVYRLASGEISSETAIQMMPDAAEACKVAISGLNKLYPVQRIEIRLDSIMKTAVYHRQIKYRESLFRKEEEVKGELMEAIGEKDLRWWKSWFSEHAGNGQPGTGQASQFFHREDTLMNQRIRSFMGLYLYMQAKAEIGKNQNETAEKITLIYELFEPQNPEANYLRAVVYARQDKKERAIEQLKIAKGKGFADQRRLWEQPEFQSLKNEAGFLELAGAPQ